MAVRGRRGSPWWGRTERRKGEGGGEKEKNGPGNDRALKREASVAPAFYVRARKPRDSFAPRVPHRNGAYNERKRETKRSRGHCAVAMRQAAAAQRAPQRPRTRRAGERGAKRSSPSSVPREDAEKGTEHGRRAQAPKTGAQNGRFAARSRSRTRCVVGKQCPRAARRSEGERTEGAELQSTNGGGCGQIQETGVVRRRTRGWRRHVPTKTRAAPSVEPRLAQVGPAKQGKPGRRRSRRATASLGEDRSGCHTSARPDDARGCLGRGLRRGRGRREGSPRRLRARGLGD